MKAEQRKELQTNWLADHLGRWLQTLSSGPSTGSTIVWGVLILVLGGGAAWWYLYAVPAAQRNAALWTKLDNTSSLDGLDTIIKENPTTPQARIAEFLKARTLLRVGLEKLAAAADKDRTEARNKVEEAATLYASLAKRPLDSPLLTQEALLGAARANESLGNIEEALAFYDQLRTRFKDSPFGKEAAATYEKLKANEDAVKAFYTEFNRLASGKAETK
jgi:tetratricopeptide (TPR) repeat protein